MAEERWATVQVGIPANLTVAADLLGSIIDFLINVANVALATLEVVKAVLIGLLDPIRALVELVIAEIEAIINDLRQLGVYLTWDETEYPFTNIVGGFQSYQTRMLAKLTNRADPTRPAFSDRSAVIGVFLYTSADPTSIYAVLDLINLLLRLFGVRRRTRGLPTPVGLTATYGGPDIAAFGNLGKILTGGDLPEVAKLRWTIAAPASTVGPVPILPAPPKFLVEVSVFEDGFGVAYNLPTPNANRGRQTFGVITDADGVPFRLYGGQTLGIEDSLKSTQSGSEYTIPGVGSDGDVKSNNVTVYAFRNSADTYPIPLSAITDRQDDGKYLFQRTFVYDVTSLLGINLLSPGQPFTFRLKAEDMPYNATISAGSNGRVTVVADDAPAREVYVRVRAVEAGYGYEADKTLNTPIYLLNETTINATGTVTPAYMAIPGEAGLGMGFGPVSDPFKVTFPESGTAEYMETVMTAVLLVLLSRSDLRPILTDDASIAYVKGVGELAEAILQAEAQVPESVRNVAANVEKEVGLCPTTLEPIARNLVPLFGAATLGGDLDLKSMFGREGTDLQAFRRQMLNRSRRLAEYVLDKAGPPTSSVLEFIEAQSQVSGSFIDEDGNNTTVPLTPLRRLTWGQVFSEVAAYPIGDVTILGWFTGRETVYEGSDGTVSGIAPNPLSVAEEIPNRLNLAYNTTYRLVRVLDLDVEEYINSVSIEGVQGAALGNILVRRSPGFLLPVKSPEANTVCAFMGQGSADMSPVVYAGLAPMYGRGDARRVLFIRNGLIRLPELASAVNRVLSYAVSAAITPTPTGAWLALRLFPQGIPPIDEFLQKISDFLQAVLDGLQGIVDAILAYIEFIEARILELEALLRRIQALIDLALSFNIGVPVSALLVNANGTDGLVRDFMGAEDAPFDGPNSMGLGFTVVAGGVPAFVLDILLSLFPEV